MGQIGLWISRKMGRSIMVGVFGRRDTLDRLVIDLFRIRFQLEMDL